MLPLLAIIAAKYLFLLSFVIAFFSFFKLSATERRRLFFFGLVALPMIFCTAVVASHFYDNPRPFVVLQFVPLIPHAPDNGFPSDHVLLVSAIAAIFMYFDRRAAALLWGVTLLVAIGRVTVGVHHATDVIASMLIALLCVFVVDYVLMFIMKKIYG
ncbi:MAG: hypothetical protein A2845_04580 [Candidatus Lloydbacteria bacterium RIFCSPHIGHO2_01_FULL_49_22]|uniref:Phosphatidic acid phosphatase type 2/haloperoxidase domain-containing protein n=1 Tax=Candidatus Lloydbacteria bacterium RIFCSPHIGHO2_01_FULL_49_22 TaxID=1798658 RepID=A0A1G2CW26_9BACT|nr:MAG: hypothetical protein A2845_04580 [Candidatus Lloydbacteria bacterium RIFCSPHIGHO2_01_FULL_49_22]OGZ10093.1 MAG: hypothetical protein A3C14_00615 [Candidatus Lloydbacteria bacterium RIFCSPHIGHO2_02_FULL_50_18]